MLRDKYKARLMNIAWSLLFAVTLIVTTFTQQAAAAEATQAGNKIVRVGYYNETNFQEGKDANSFKKGYAYEYYQMLAHETGWQYEYVYGEYDKLYAKLLKGEIDLLAGLGMVEARKKVMSYPELPMVYESYELIKRVGDERFGGQNLNDIAGKKVGVLDGAMMVYFEKYRAEHNLQVEVVKFANMKQRDAALRNGEVDVIVAEESMGDMDGVEAFRRVWDVNVYMVVNKQRPDILAELNDAQAKLIEDNRVLIHQLRSKYFRRTAYRVSLSAPEREWVSQHKELKIGYLKNFVPFAKQEQNGEVTGVVKDLTTAILKELRIDGKVEPKYISYDTAFDFVEALKRGDIDAVFPIDADNWVTEKYGVMASNGALNTSLRLIYKGNTVPQVKKLAARKDLIYDSALAKIYYPEAEIIFFDSLDACLKAVEKGTVDGTLKYGARSNAMSLNDYDDLNSTLLNGRMCGYGVKAGNVPLLKILNRGTAILDPSYGQSLLQKYDIKEETFTLKHFLRHYLAETMLASLLLVVGVLIIASMFYRSSRQTKALNADLEAAIADQKEKFAEIAKLNASLEEARETADAANKAKTNFLFNMSHDIRTPMNAIIGFTDLARKHIGNEAKVEDYLGKISSANDVLLSLINNVLEMARIDSGEEVLNETVLKDSSLSESVVTLFEGQMAEKGITFKHSSEIEHRNILVDRTKMRQIMVNLLSNALKYTPAGGTVSMHIAEIPSDKPGYVLIKNVIEDNGIGMSKDFLPHIFDEFTRDKATAGSNIVGTGLGTAIVKKLIDLMGGTIEVESELGKGTKFTFVIPHRLVDMDNLEEQEKHVVSAEGACKLKGKRVLLAEDNDINAEIATVVLEEEGLLVERAEDGRICVDMLKKAETGYYDLVLMDIQMPNMDGYAAAKAIRSLEDKTKANIPIVAMTANAFNEDKLNAFRAGMNAHVGKPFEIKELLEALNQLL